MQNENSEQLDADMNALPADVDPIWLSSRTARQIYALGEVEKVRTNGITELTANRSHSLTAHLWWLSTGYQQVNVVGSVQHRAAHSSTDG